MHVLALLQIQTDNVYNVALVILQVREVTFAIQDALQTLSQSLNLMILSLLKKDPSTMGQAKLTVHSQCFTLSSQVQEITKV